MLQNEMGDAQPRDQLQTSLGFDAVQLCQEPVNIWCQGRENLRCGQRQKADVVLRIGTRFRVTDEGDSFLLSL